ncbi:hypothetical protein ACWKSP_00500 [Micromonosporaceae bacterium Da 78-11]
MESIAALTDTKLHGLGYSDRDCEAHFNDVMRLVRGAFDRFRGADPPDGPVWELSDLGRRPWEVRWQRADCLDTDTVGRTLRRWVDGLPELLTLRDPMDHKSGDTTMGYFKVSIQPSDVKPGGGQCPIRFSCSSCGFSRPDPSFQNVVTSIGTQLAAMPDDERHHLKEAAAVRRTVRAAAPLPIRPVPARRASL